MTISLISHNHVATFGLQDSFSIPVSASAGDIIELALQYGDNSGATFTPTWNGQTFVEISTRVSAGSFFFHRLYVVASSTATSNITGGTSPTFVLLNHSYKVWRSSTNTFANPPIKAGSYKSQVYNSGGFIKPSLTNSLVSGEVVSGVLATSGWDTSFESGTCSFTDDAPSVSIGQAANTSETKIKYIRSLYTTGSGSVTTALTKSGTHSPMYQFSTVVFYEAAQQITSINGGNPITAGQTEIAVIADGFTAKPTAVTATYESGSKSISATIGAGTATNFVINIQDRVDGEDWPLNNTAITFTFTYSSETASLNKNLVKKASEVVYTFSSAVTNDPQSIAYHLTQDGFTAEGGEHVYLPYGDLVLTAEGGWTVTNAGTFTSWFRPSTGTGAGNVYEYQWQVTEAGISPISSKAITAKALTCAGLSASGFVCTPM